MPMHHHSRTTGGIHISHGSHHSHMHRTPIRGAGGPSNPLLTSTFAALTAMNHTLPPGEPVHVPVDFVGPAAADTIDVFRIASCVYPIQLHKVVPRHEYIEAITKANQLLQKCDDQNALGPLCILFTILGYAFLVPTMILPPIPQIAIPLGLLAMKFLWCSTCDRRRVARSSLKKYLEQVVNADWNKKGYLAQFEVDDSPSSGPPHAKIVISNQVPTRIRTFRRFVQECVTDRSTNSGLVDLEVGGSSSTSTADAGTTMMKPDLTPIPDPQLVSRDLYCTGAIVPSIQTGFDGDLSGYIDRQTYRYLINGINTKIYQLNEEPDKFVAFTTGETILNVLHTLSIPIPWLRSYLQRARVSSRIANTLPQLNKYLESLTCQFPELLDHGIGLQVHEKASPGCNPTSHLVLSVVRIEWEDNLIMPVNAGLPMVPDGLPTPMMMPGMMPGQPMPGMMPGQPMPGMMPGQPMPGYPTMNPDGTYNVYSPIPQAVQPIAVAPTNTASVAPAEEDPAIAKHNTTTGI